MPNFIRELITCSDIGSCFQMIYNLLLTLLVVLAFMYGVYGALEYLFSAASVTKQESGKNKIINAIGAILVAFILPSVLNMINPNIFRVKWVFPRIERAKSPYLEINGYNAGYSEVNPQNPPRYIGYVTRSQVSPFECSWGVPLIKQTDLRYANIPYGNGFIGPSGCGLVSLVMAKARCEGWCNDGISEEEKDRVKILLENLVGRAVNDGGGANGTPKDFIKKYAGKQIDKRDENEIKDGIKQGKFYIWNIRDEVYKYGHYLIIAGMLPQCNISGEIFNDCIILKDPSDGNYVATPLSKIWDRTQEYNGKPTIWEVDCGKLNF